MFRRTQVILILLAFSIGGWGCSRKTESLGDPKSTLAEYISRTFSIKSSTEKNSLLELLSGDAKERLMLWSDAQFEEVFVQSKRRFLKLSVKEVKSVSTSEVNVTYELSFLNQQDGKNSTITQKKIAQMVLDSNRWLISNVRNVKELIEYENEMSLP